jgi:hypothetical protein
VFVVFCEWDAEIFTLDFETCSSAKPNHSERKDEGDRLSVRGKERGRQTAGKRKGRKW